jgi:uncharacterized protein YbjT (DUF2867 family)
VILVTGATGNVGGEVWRMLGPARARRAVRNPRSPETDVRLDFEDAGTFAAALRGIERVFLVRPPSISDMRRTLIPFVDAARAAGVRHVVFLSLAGAERNPVVPHRAVEDHLRRGGPPWTLLRAGFFMQNLSTTHRHEIRDHDEIRVPAGGGRTSLVDARDLASAAVRVLTEAGHEGRAYTLTGAEALTYAEGAAILSEVLGRRVRYARPGLVRFVRQKLREGHPLDYVLVLAAIYTTARLGLAGRVEPDLATLLGRPPTSFRTFAEDHREVWMR